MASSRMAAVGDRAQTEEERKGPPFDTTRYEGMDPNETREARGMITKAARDPSGHTAMAAGSYGDTGGAGSLAHTNAGFHKGDIDTGAGVGYTGGKAGTLGVDTQGPPAPGSQAAGPDEFDSAKAAAGYSPQSIGKPKIVS